LTTSQVKEQNAMSDPRQTLHKALAFRGNRRRAAQTIAAAGGLLLLGAATRPSSRLAIAQSGDDDDNSGHGGDDQDNSGHGNAEDRGPGNEEPGQITGQVPEGAVEVRIVSDDAGGFVPGELTVDLGQTVAFVNAHSDEHTATGSGFDTGIIPDEGGTATVVLDTPGVFPYACQIHPVMTGVIRVRDENGVVPQTQTTAQEVPADATTVVIANLAFDPSAITVPTGTTVAWTNEDAAPHTVTSADGAFDSGIFDPGSSFAFTFNEPGSFPYACQLHPQMQGTVTAEGEAVAAAPASDSQTATTAEDTTAQPQEAAEAGEATVSIVDFAFEPATLDVSAGTTVVWTNTGQAPHTVTGDFADSGVLEPGQTFSHTFAQSGDFSYVCAIHPQMTGAIRVGVAAAPASTLTATPAADGTTVEGVWLIQLTPDNEEILRRHQALATFHADGTVEADFSAVSGAGAATSVLTAGRGEWLLQEQGQGTVCRVSLIALMNDADRRFAGTAKVEAEARLDATGRAIDGAFEYAVVSAGGQSLGDGSGTLSGESVPLDP
jgi:plastocyanin